MLHFVLNINKCRNIYQTNSKVKVNLTNAPTGNVVQDWRERNQISLDDLVTAFKSHALEVLQKNIHYILQYYYIIHLLGMLKMQHQSWKIINALYSKKYAIAKKTYLSYV